MKRVQRGRLGHILALLLGMGMTGCGLVEYPGQPGQMTDGFAKIDLEVVDGHGTWVYETTYEKPTFGGPGVEQVVTKLYPRALTYTSNSRSGSHGTFYRHKDNYNGAEVQMIYLPATQEVIMSQDSKVEMFINQMVSLDEVDYGNLAEKTLFETARAPEEPLSLIGEMWQQIRHQAMLLGSYLGGGRLGYSVSQLQFGESNFTPASPIRLEVNRPQTGVAIAGESELGSQLAGFLDQHFPHGYTGPLVVRLASGGELTLQVELYTVASLQHSGKNIRRISRDQLQHLAAQTSSEPMKNKGVR